ncbi:MAG: L,D-transpeptidase family protein [Neomegalonema sp.]|nr:L,D-transpeptidase family protein [Neomegalonema sp.]
MGRWRIASAFLAATIIAPAGVGAKEAVAKPSPDPLQIVISLRSQTLKLYRGDVLIRSSRVSTGKAGHRTPWGVYSILEKRRRHYSNIYDRAPMPYMQRITWSGLALHQGRVPRRPASHGCVRLPRSFARRLFRMTTVGASVIITPKTQAPRLIAHPKLFRHVAPARFSDAPVASKAPKVGKLLYALFPHSLATVDIEPASVGRESPAPSRGPLIWASAFDIDLDADRGFLHLPASDQRLRVLILAGPKDTPVTAAQKILAGLGYDVGEADGAYGRRTAKAVLAFQRAKGLPRTGTLNKETLAALYGLSKIKRANGHLFIRRGYKDVFDAPVTFRNPKGRIGTHVFTAMRFEPGRKPGVATSVRWTVLTVDDAKGADGADAISVLDRISIPAPARDWIESLLRPGSTIIVSDGGFRRETGKGTDFIVQRR